MSVDTLDIHASNQVHALFTGQEIFFIGVLKHRN